MFGRTLFIHGLIETDVMSTLQGRWGKDRSQKHLADLTDKTRRRIVRILSEQTGTVTEQELAKQLQNTFANSKPAVTASERMEKLRIRLHHVHLPKLEESELIEWDKDDQTVAAINDSKQIVSKVEKRVLADGEDGFGVALFGDRLQAELTLLRSKEGPLSRMDIAEEVASIESDGQPSEALIEDINVQLHHHHLPKLQEAGLIEYNTDDATVTYETQSEPTTTLPET
jgi:DNA-binding transcriptional ArsR family regulator